MTQQNFFGQSITLPVNMTVTGGEVREAWSHWIYTGHYGDHIKDMKTKANFDLVEMITEDYGLPEMEESSMENGVHTYEILKFPQMTVRKVDGDYWCDFQFINVFGKVYLFDEEETEVDMVVNLQEYINSLARVSTPEERAATRKKAEQILERNSAPKRTVKQNLIDDVETELYKIEEALDDLGVHFTNVIRQLTVLGQDQEKQSEYFSIVRRIRLLAQGELTSIVEDAQELLEEDNLN